MQTSHSVDREGLMSDFEVGRHHRQLIETRRAAISLVPRPHPSAREKGLVKNDNIPGPEAGIWESQSDRSICN